MNVTDTDALIVVDVQNYFCPGGALPVPGGDSVVTVINRIITHFDEIIYTRDWHPEDHCSFSLNPTYEDGSWPPHCVQHSPGAEFQGSLRVPLDAPVIDKGTDPDEEQYGAFRGTPLADLLRLRGIKRVFVVGLATDYCVKCTALEGLEAGFEVVLLVDACRGVNDQATEAAVQTMAEAGVTVIRSGQLE